MFQIFRWNPMDSRKSGKWWNKSWWKFSGFPRIPVENSTVFRWNLMENVSNFPAFSGSLGPKFPLILPFSTLPAFSPGEHFVKSLINWPIINLFIPLYSKWYPYIMDNMFPPKWIERNPSLQLPTFPPFYPFWPKVGEMGEFLGKTWWKPGDSREIPGDSPGTPQGRRLPG